jgi:hypothetical protein
MKSELKAPGTRRLNLKYAELVSGFAFKFDFRRYTKHFETGLDMHAFMQGTDMGAEQLKVRRCRLTLSNPR